MLALDHIVFSGTDMDFHNESNNHHPIKAVKGGEHDHWGTYNYLAHFSNDSYLEWLGIRDYDKAKQSDNPLIKHLIYVSDQGKEGPFQFALRTNQLDKFVSHFEENDIPYKGPFQGNRNKPDGTQLKWRMLFPEYDYRTEVLPFLIEWQSPNHISSLYNPQTITAINIGSISTPKFRQIYHLKPRKLLKNRVLLQNSKIFFNDDNKFSFDLD